MAEARIGDGLLLGIVPGNAYGVVGDEFLKVTFHKKSLAGTGVTPDDDSAEVSRLGRKCGLDIFVQPPMKIKVVQRIALVIWSGGSHRHTTKAQMSGSV